MVRTDAFNSTSLPAVGAHAKPASTGLDRLFHTPGGLSTKRLDVTLPPIDRRALMQNAHRIAPRGDRSRPPASSPRSAPRSLLAPTRPSSLQRAAPPPAASARRTCRFDGGANMSTGNVVKLKAPVGKPARSRATTRKLRSAAAEQFAARAETAAAMATGQVTAAVAILAKNKDQLVSLIAAAGQHEAAEAHDALTRALAGADTLPAIFRAAEARFLIAAAAAARASDCYR
jgi:hypothetical protein